MTTLAIANSPGHGMRGSHPNGDYALPGQVFLSSTDVPPESLVYGLATEVGDPIQYNVSAVSDSGDTGFVVIDAEGVPTITGPYGMYEVMATWTNQTTGLPVNL
jgi:hypothetical protein